MHWFTAISLGLLVATPTSWAISVANYTDAKNKRFEGDATFIGDNYDWSGVGRSTTGKWATLIGDNYFISANHFRPAEGEQIHFVTGNNPANPTLSYTVAGGTRVGTTDLWIGWTQEAMDSSLARYNLRVQAANSVADTGLAGTDLFVSGDLVAGQSGSVRDHIVATNRVESYRDEGTTAMVTAELTVNFSTATGWDQLALFRNESADNVFFESDYEAQLQDGDSGSPLFVTSGNDLEIVGIAWAVSTGLPGNFINTSGPAGSTRDPFENRDASYYTYVGSYDSEITTAVALVPDSVPAISLAVSDSETSEFDVSDTAELTLTADVAPASDLSINYTLSGTAINSTDYLNLSGSATLPMGTLSTTIPVTAITDSEVEGDELLTLTLSSSANYAITVGNGSDDITIKDLPFDEYRFTQFGGATENIGPGEDFDGDGILNLVEYAFGLDSQAISQSPLTFEFLDMTNELQLSYEEDTTLTDIDYTIETSSSLLDGSWSESGFTLEQGSVINGKQAVNAKLPISGGNGFMRLRVERVTP